MTRRTYVGFVRAVMIGRDGLHRDVLLDIVEQAGGGGAVCMRDPGGLIEGSVGERVTTRAWGTITRIVGKLA